MSDEMEALNRMNAAIVDFKLASEDFKRKMAVNRDNELTQAEFLSYMEGVIWAEERGLK